MVKPGVWMVAGLAALLGGCSTALSHEPSPGYYTASTTKPYGDVMAELELAITERNFRITGHNKIGSVIRERDHIPFPDYDTVQFCNLTHARVMLEIEPAAVRYMPCNVAVRQEGDKVVVTTHLLPTDSVSPDLNAFAVKMNEQLKAIVDFAVEN
jgi:uncharacterized protein (DUF302 family)